MNKTTRLRIILAVVGALIGLWLSPDRGALAAFWDGIDPTAQTLLYVIIGALIGVAAEFAYHWLRASGHTLQIEEVSLPLLGGAKISLNDEGRKVAWRMFVEIASRIATQELKPGTGKLGEALDSLYGIFTSTRDELKTMSPSVVPLSRDQMTVETYGLNMLNQVLRPFLARWHPRRMDWQDTGAPGHLWPLGKLCRQDLEATRQQLLVYAWGLARIARVPQPGRLLPAEPDPNNLATLMDEDVISAQEQGIKAGLGSAQGQMGWRMYVEIKAHLVVDAVEPTAASLGQSLGMLSDLSVQLRRELKRMGGPTPPITIHEHTVEGVTLRILHEHLLPFLAHWQPRLQSWRLEPGSATGEWPEANQCLEALRALGRAVDGEEVPKLEKLLDYNQP